MSIGNDRRTRRRKRIEPSGVLCETKWYTRHGLKRAAGFGHSVFADLLKAEVRSVLVGGTRWFSGAGVIQWIESQAK
jgi:hypothetical protein